MTVHSWGVELAGLVDDLLGDRDLADVVQKRGELEVAAGLGAEAELFGDFHGKRDDALAVLRGVAVVGLDDVPEDEGRAAVRTRELEHAFEPSPAVVGENRE
jgi:hypothetical protein